MIHFQLFLWLSFLFYSGLMLIVPHLPLENEYHLQSDLIVAFDHGGDIYLTNFFDNPVNITNSDSYDILPVWSPDGSQIAFLSSPSYGDYDKYRLHVMTLTTGDVRRLSDVNFTTETMLTWSPDGRYITATLGTVYIIDIENEDDRNLVVNCGSCPVTWLPDSSGLIVASSDGLFKIDLTEKNREQIFAAPPYTYYPQLSPVSSDVVFASNLDDIPGLYNINLHTLAISRIVGMPGHDIFWHKWSPDGRYIAFTVSASYGVDVVVPGGSDIYIVRSDGTGMQVLTGDTSDGLIDWENDSQHILYYAGEAGSAGGSYFAVNVTDLTQTRLSSAEMDAMCSYSNCRNFDIRP